jgi:putative transcriptional regulator
MDLKVGQGTLLAAGPDLMDPNFMHGVVLVCQHTDEGAYGLVVNRVSDYDARQVLGEHEVFHGREVPQLPIFLGGPVGLDTLQILHRAPDRVSGGVEVAEGIHVGGELATVAELMLSDPERARRDLRLTLGYSGWGEGQLEVELATGSWLPAPCAPELVFSEDVSGVWRRVVRSVGEGAADMADQPPDPEWN